MTDMLGGVPAFVYGLGGIVILALVIFVLVGWLIARRVGKRSGDLT